MYRGRSRSISKHGHPENFVGEISISANFSVNYVEGLFFRTANRNEFPSAGWRSIWGSVFRSQLGWVWAWQTNREAALDKACKNTLQQTTKQYYIHVYTFHALFSSYTHIYINVYIYTVCQHPQRSILLIYIYMQCANTLNHPFAVWVVADDLFLQNHHHAS